jgi:hypothetical protein
LVPILANRGDRLTQEDQAEQLAPALPLLPFERSVGGRTERRRWEQDRGGAQRKNDGNGTIDRIRRRNNLIHPTTHIKQVTIHSSDLRIMRVSSQMVAFQ